MNDLQIVMREDVAKSVFRLRISHIALNSLDVSPLCDPQILMIHSVIVTTTFSCET